MESAATHARPTEDAVDDEAPLLAEHLPNIASHILEWKISMLNGQNIHLPESQQKNHDIVTQVNSLNYRININTSTWRVHSKLAAYLCHTNEIVNLMT